MKYIFLFCFGFYSFLFSQIDDKGNPIFNSIFISEDSLSNCIMHSNYYTISNNIDNPNSSVFVSIEPTNEEVLEFTRKLPSYFFIISSNHVASYMIMAMVRIENKKSIYSFNILNPNTGEQIEIPSNSKGDVTEFRAAELLNKYPDVSKELKIGPNRMILFDNIAYSIQYFNNLKNEVIELVKKYELHKNEIDLKSIIKK